MSKILKAIVNIFIILAIASAVAIIVPPLAGVTTTIIDTQSINTNLPLGSITYSNSVNVTEIQTGDKVLKESDSSIYAYVIQSGDAATGQYQAISATDSAASEETIVLRNNVSKIVLTIPFIGYILVAMHSMEGIIIVALCVLLMIIFFILSELWKKDSSDDDEDDEDEDDDEDDDEEEEKLSRRELRKRKRAKKYDEEDDGDEDDDEEDEDDEDDRLSRKEKKAEKEKRKAEKKARKEAKKAEKKRRKEEKKASRYEDDDDDDEDDYEDEEPKTKPAALKEEPSYDNETTETNEIPKASSVDENELPEESMPVIEENDTFADVESEVKTTNTFDETAEEDLEHKDFKTEDLPQIDDPEKFMDAAPVQEQTEPVVEPESAEDDVSFTPIPRLTLEELKEQAEKNGEEPNVIKDPTTGITLLDYSDLI